VSVVRKINACSVEAIVRKPVVKAVLAVENNQGVCLLSTIKEKLYKLPCVFLGVLFECSLQLSLEAVEDGGVVALLDLYNVEVV
jgi:hypothetical protein